MVLSTQILEGFEPITLEEMEKVRLMNRIDTKYVTTVPVLEQLLQLARSSYRIQQIGSRRNMPYYTCYFDTPRCDMFREHQRGRKCRQKIRLRVYEDSETAFIEIKKKNNKGRTKKKRVLVESRSSDLTDYAEFIQTHSAYLQRDLVRQVENRFTRITLVNHDMTERVTIDTGLQFRNLITGDQSALPELVIIEWKRSGIAAVSPLQGIIRDLHIQPSGFSKYCVGMALTNKTLKLNRMKLKLRMLDRLRQSVQ
ncbi:MAG: polyphosphate polymerase domain-containing protein [Coprobacter sp.]|nr:polyphosphate polymerase domain-containing protein [Coprobacter sp.]